jgi:hypothetical protein
MSNNIPKPPDFGTRLSSIERQTVNIPAMIEKINYLENVLGAVVELLGLDAVQQKVDETLRAKSTASEARQAAVLAANANLRETSEPINKNSIVLLRQLSEKDGVFLSAVIDMRAQNQEEMFLGLRAGETKHPFYVVAVYEVVSTVSSVPASES